MLWLHYSRRLELRLKLLFLIKLFHKTTTRLKDSNRPLESIPGIIPRVNKKEAGYEPLSHYYSERLGFRDGNRRFDGTFMFDRRFNLNHVISRDNVHIMCRFHMLDYSLRNLIRVHSDRLE